ncbi:MAG: alanyl-tRNA editing protein [Oscillospiraceae bacterium]|nr:alanyl-tRNA editing protein [Oscillospiraceae bacterium]
MTEKLYDRDSHLKEFTARVLSCANEGNRWAVALDRTAFFPEGGGQAADTGSLNSARVLDVQEVSGEILHYTDSPLKEGETVTGLLDWEQRFRRMQNHSGEHLLSGLVYARYGYRNVGFHLGDGDVTVDFDGELDRTQLEELETAVNRAISENVPVTCWYPPKEELNTLDYRSKLELTENVRLVKFEGYDLCACCAPHVSRTGEIGSMHILDHMRHRGGVRLHMLCGLDAMEDARARYLATAAISGLLSVPQLETPKAVKRVLGELEDLKQALAESRRQIIQMKADAVTATEGNLCFFERDMDMLSLRELVNAGMAKCGGICAAFTGSDGDWKYIIGSRSMDLRSMAKEINAAIGGRGGGRPEMIQGSSTASRRQIEAYFCK